MILNAVRGALGFLTRLPVGRDEVAFDAFRRTPAAFPLAGYPIGLALALAVVLPFPAPTVALCFLIAVLVVTGVNHADGLADLGDAVVVHGGPDRRRAVMTDTTIGVGAILALTVSLGGITLAGLALAAVPLTVAGGIVVASEVGAKLGMAVLICREQPGHEGFGSQFLSKVSGRQLWLSVAVAVPAGLFADGVGYFVLLASVAVAVAIGRWARIRLGGVTGDVLGATNELARVAGLHVGVIVWTLW